MATHPKETIHQPEQPFQEAHRLSTHQHGRETLSSARPTSRNNDPGKITTVNRPFGHTSEQVLVVDDDPHTCKLVAFLLEEAGYGVVTTCEGERVAELLLECDPDLVILDLALPEMSGFDICDQIRLRSTVPIIFISGYAQIENRVFGLQIGADDFLARPFEPVELLARIEALFRRRKRNNVRCATSITNGKLTLDLTEQHLIGAYGKPIQLTPIETRLLHYLMEHAGIALRVEQICKAIWGEATADTHSRLYVNIRRLRMKIEQSTMPFNHITTIRNVGYRFEETSVAP